MIAMADLSKKSTQSLLLRLEFKAERVGGPIEHRFPELDCGPNLIGQADRVAFVETLRRSIR